jgi:hypothetical protein
MKDKIASKDLSNIDFTTYLKLLVSCGLQQDAIKMFQERVASSSDGPSGTLVNDIHVVVLLQGLRESGLLARSGLDIYKQCLENPSLFPGLSSNHAVVSCVLELLSVEKPLQPDFVLPQLIDLLAGLKQRDSGGSNDDGLMPSPHLGIYGKAIALAGQCGCADVAESVYRDANALIHDEQSLYLNKSLMIAMLATGNHDRCVGIYQQLMETSGGQCDVYATTVALNACINSRKLHLAFDIFQKYCYEQQGDLDWVLCRAALRLCSVAYAAEHGGAALLQTTHSAADDVASVAERQSFSVDGSNNNNNSLTVRRERVVRLVTNRVKHHLRAMCLPTGAAKTMPIDVLAGVSPFLASSHCVDLIFTVAQQPGRLTGFFEHGLLSCMSVGLYRREEWRSLLSLQHRIKIHLAAAAVEHHAAPNGSVDPKPATKTKAKTTTHNQLVLNREGFVFVSGAAIAALMKGNMTEKANALIRDLLMDDDVAVSSKTSGSSLGARDLSTLKACFKLLQCGHIMPHVLSQLESFAAAPAK